MAGRGMKRSFSIFGNVKTPTMNQAQKPNFNLALKPAVSSGEQIGFDFTQKPSAGAPNSFEAMKTSTTQTPQNEASSLSENLKGAGSIASGAAALANVAVGIEGINEAKRARRDANKQLGIENDRYDNALKKQENFLNEVNASASNFEAPKKRQNPMERM